MKKLFALLLLSATVLMAGGIRWEQNYQAAVQLAAKSNKPIFFVVSSHACKWCRRLEATTLSDPKVIAELNKHFINVIAYSEAGDFVPNELWTTSTPTLWFLNTKGKPMFQPIRGAVGTADFLKATDMVLEAFKKNGLKQ